MNILVNATNLSGGGGVQVADSICRCLDIFTRHRFIVVYNSVLFNIAKTISDFHNVEVIQYNYPPRDLYSFFTCRNRFLDQLVEKYNIDCVLTIFGPMKWRPRCPHVCGFALSQIVIPESPYYKRMSLFGRTKARLHSKIWEYIFRRSSRILYTENPFITERLKKKFRRHKIYTITNNYNQVFDHKDKWTLRKLPDFDGIQLISISSSSPHKNLPISLDVARILRDAHPGFKFRFVFTIEESEFPAIPDDLKKFFCFIGKVDISECPSLYSQCDFVFQPTLIECFTATYPEAMVMKKPIITTDLEFARGICKDAAVYYDALSPKSAADTIFQLASNIQLQKRLILEGIKRLSIFDTSSQRAEKIISLCESSSQLF